MNSGFGMNVTDIKIDKNEQGEFIVHTTTENATEYDELASNKTSLINSSNFIKFVTEEMNSNYFYVKFMKTSSIVKYFTTNTVSLCQPITNNL